MPFVNNIFEKAFAFVTRFAARDPIKRADFDTMYDDLVAGINGANIQIGLGGQSPALLENIDDATEIAGFYRTDATTTGTFPTVDKVGSVLYWRSDDDDLMQVFWSKAHNTIWFRRYSVSAWQDWGTIRSGQRVRHVVAAASLSDPVTLPSAPKSVNDLDVIIDGVVQEPSEWSLDGIEVSYIGSSPTTNGWPTGIAHVMFVYMREG